jgi:hypothetical protein
MGARIDELRNEHADQIRRLEWRIEELRHVDPEPVADPPIPAAPRVPEANEETIELPQPVEPPPSASPLPPPLPIPPPPAPPATDWEAIIGGNWANKAGVLVLIIGLALFLQYSLTHLGPGGRVALGYLLSASMLMTGVLLEKHDQWRVYARGLIGGGWAGLYFTTYAAHAIDAARVIESPTLATALLLAVAVGMIVHSLRYRSETVTGLSYFITFGTLAISPLSAFAVIAVLPLAASLLWVARRYHWTATVVAGQLFTFLLYLIHIGEVGFRPDRLVWGELALVAYWILFELYDVAFAGRVGGILRSSLIVINTAGFLMLSLSQWRENRPATLWIPLFIGAALYAAGCSLRARLNPPSSFGGGGLDTRVTAGGYEGAAAVASALAVAGTFNAFHGFWINAALLVQAELLLWLSVRYQQSFLRNLSSITFVFPVGKLALDDVPSQTHWNPIALATAAVALGNRVWRRELIGYSFVAGVVTATVLSFELPAEWVPFSWLLLGAVTFEISDGKDRSDWQGVSLALGLVASVGLFFHNILDFGMQGLHPWIAQLACAVLMGAVAFRAHLVQPKQGASLARDLSAGLCAASVAALAHTLLPDYAVVLAWAVIVWALLETGLRVKAMAIRAEAHALLFLTCGWLLAFDVFDDRLQFWHLSRGFLVCAPIVALLYFTRARYGIEWWERGLTRLYSFFGALVALLVVHTDFDRAVAITAWALMGFVLLMVARRDGGSDFFLQAYLISALAFARVIWECVEPHRVLGFHTALLTGLPVAALFYAAEFLLPRGADHYRAPRTWYSAAASFLVAAILWLEVRGGLLTIAWALEAVSLLVAGFPLRERVLRLSGLLLLCVCVLKVFFYDLSTLSRPYQILSFVALGVVLLCSSAFYTRFRERFREYFL